MRGIGHCGIEKNETLRVLSVFLSPLPTPSNASYIEE